jgi:hypothetical protein
MLTFQTQPQRAAELVERMRIERTQCPRDGSALVLLEVVGRMERLRCPDKFCGYELARER